jgi:hypothetical protein
MQFSHILANKATQEVEQKRNLSGGPRPIFRTEGINREVFNAEIGGRSHGAAQGINACLMSRRPWQSTVCSPTPIAIHDNSNMTGHNGRSGQHGALQLLKPA